MDNTGNVEIKKTPTIESEQNIDKTEIFENAKISEAQINDFFKTETPEAIELQPNNEQNPNEPENKPAEVTIKNSKTEIKNAENAEDKLLLLTAKTISGTITAVFVFLCILLDGRESASHEDYTPSNEEREEEAQLLKQLFKAKGVEPPIEFTFVAHLISVRIRHIYTAWNARKKAKLAKIETDKILKENAALKQYFENLKRQKVEEKTAENRTETNPSRTEQTPAFSLGDSGN